MTRRTFAGGLAAAPLLAQGRRPNIVFISSDQHSGRFLGANGHLIVKTPNLDRIAAMGVNFRNCYSGNPVCAPGRACMMTGMYASDVNSFCNATPFDGRVPSWGNRLRDAGYYCRATGKMDLTEGRDFGFDEQGTHHGHSSKPDITALFRSPVCLRPEEREIVNGSFQDRRDSDEDLTDDGLEFLRKRAQKMDKPWALYIGMHMPHPKWVAAKKWAEVYRPENMALPDVPQGYLDGRHPVLDALANYKNIAKPIAVDKMRRARAAYFGMVSEVDEFVGRLLDAADLLNTLFIYTSDHGESLGEHGLWLKNNLMENAARVPLVMAGAGVPKGRTVTTACGHVDMVATMLEAAGVRAQGLRGRSLLADGHPGVAYSESHSEGNSTGSAMIRKGDWKYLYFTGDEPLLFDLKNDPGELENLAGTKAAALKQKELHAHLIALVDPDAVTERAFAEQERRLNAMVKKMRRDDFEEMLTGRLGGAQARVLAMRHYRARG